MKMFTFLTMSKVKPLVWDFLIAELQKTRHKLFTIIPVLILGFFIFQISQFCEKAYSQFLLIRNYGIDFDGYVLARISRIMALGNSMAIFSFAGLLFEFDRRSKTLSTFQITLAPYTLVTAKTFFIFIFAFLFFAFCCLVSVIFVRVIQPPVELFGKANLLIYIFTVVLIFIESASAMVYTLYCLDLHVGKRLFLLAFLAFGGIILPFFVPFGPLFHLSFSNELEKMIDQILVPLLIAPVFLFIWKLRTRTTGSCWL